MVQEFGELNEVGFTRWVSSGWNLFEAAYIVSIWLCLMSAWLYLAEEKTFLGHYNNSGSDNDTELLFNDTELLFNDMMPVRDSYKRMNKYIGFTMFCSWLKVLKYAKIFRSTQVLWDTLSAARYQLFAYSMVMLIMINAFAFLTVMLWGYSSKFFHNMPTAFFALVRLTAGEADMDYAELKRGDSSVTPFVFMGFIIFIAFIGMNMMIAIVTDYYEKARDKQQAWEADTQWIREQFSGKRQYEDFYRGKGLWNEPVYDTPMTGPIGQAWKSLRGHWLVKPIPVGCGPRKWNANEEKVEPKFETQRYPFVLHKSSLVLLRYGIESHEPNVRLHSVQDDEAKDHKYRSQHKPDEAARRETTDTLESFSRSKMSCTPLRSRDKSRIPEDTPDEQAQFGALKAWMSAENFSQYKGTSYLELLKGPTYKGEEVDAMDRSKLEKVVKELSVVDLKSLKRLDTDQLKDRLRDHLAVLRGADRPSCCGSFAKAVLTSCCCWWLRSSCACCRCGGDGGDELSLLTTEDGLRGKIVLEFQKLLRVRRASNSDRAAIIQRIQEKRQEYHAALEEECKEGHCYRHSAVADGDGLQHGGEGCRKCAIVNACHERVQECEHDLQRLHEQRGELEGVERIMVFRVKKVDAWQKFRPPDVRADEVAGNVGRLLKDKAMDGNITKEEVIQVLTEVVANVRQHEWDDETTTRAKLQDQPLSSLDERVHELKLDDDKKRRLVKIVLETEAARQHHKIATQTGQLLDRLNAMTTEQLMAYAESLQYFIDEHRLLVDVLLAEEMAQPDHKSKLRKEWLDTDVIEEDGKPVKRRVLIEKEVEQVMQQMANDEADKRQERDRDSSPAANCRSRSRHPAPIEDVMTRLLDKSNKGCKHEDLLEGDHDLASVMRRLLKKAQRVSSATAHAPQLEVAESSEFKLRVPFCLQTQIVMRALCDRLRPSWERCCNMLYWLWPLGFITRHFYFQESIESHVDGFLRHKCVHIRAGMPRGQSLKLQMAEFMSPAHSVPLSDFLCVRKPLCASLLCCPTCF